MEHRQSAISRRIEGSEPFAVRLAYAICITIIFLRNPVAVTRAEFWAEDATEFFFGALSLGPEGLITPVYGYHMFLGRLIAWAASFLPVFWTPYIYALTSLLIGALATSYFTRDGFSWIIPSRIFRIFVCAVLAIGPGTTEVFMNLCNLPSVLSFIATLLLLEKPFRIGNAKLAVMIVLILSAAPIFLLAPLVAYLWHGTRDNRYLLLLLCFVPVIAINAYGSHQVTGAVNIRTYANAWLVPQLLAEHSFIRLFYMPILGNQATAFLMRDGAQFWLVSVAAGGAFLYLANKSALMRQPQSWPLLIAFFCTLAMFGIIAIARNYALVSIARESGNPLWGSRYSYWPGMAALIAWFALLFAILNRRTREVKTVLAGLGIFLLAAHNVAELNTYYRRPDLRWPAVAATLQDIIDRKKNGTLKEQVVVDNIRWVHPVGWRPVRDNLRIVLPAN